jgi:DNA-binding transcriptional MerR regulator
MYYTIGQVSKIAGLPQSVLRYWETVFESLNPPKSDGGTRQYTENNVEIILEIKKLLYDEGYTIKGANKHINTKYSTINESTGIISEEKKKDNPILEESASKVDNATIEHIKQKIHSILELLDEG